MDHKIFSSWLLCHFTNAWFCSRFVNWSSSIFFLFLEFCWICNSGFYPSTVGYNYFFSSHIRRGIVYGDQPRNRYVKSQDCWIVFSYLIYFLWSLIVELKLISVFGSLDLYLPKNSDGPKPVVAFVTGGAWIIGWAVRSFCLPVFFAWVIDGRSLLALYVFCLVHKYFTCFIDTY